MGEKFNSSDSLYHDLILLSWVNIKKMNLTKSPSLLLQRIIISFLVKCDRMYLIRCNNEINDWACSAGFAWEDHRKPYELAQSSILLLGRLRHILSRLTRQEMTIRRKKSDGLFLLVIPLFGRIKMLIMQSAVCTLWPNRSSLLFGKYLEILLIRGFNKTTELYYS